MKLLLGNSLLLLATAAGSYTYFTHRRLSSTYQLPITSTNTKPHSLTNSHTNRVIVNPNNYFHLDDSRELPLALGKPLSDEQILSRFIQGFFGGWIFAPESVILKLGDLAGIPLNKIAALGSEGPSHTIWSRNNIPRDRVSEKGVSYFGAFRLAARSIREHSSAKGATNDPESESYVDFVYGWDDGSIRGVHRFSVLRRQGMKAGEDEEVRIRFAHTISTPKGDKPLKPDLMESFHAVYAMLLFREGVAAILEA